jgi:lysophospholipase L1-like esterase
VGKSTSFFVSSLSASSAAYVKQSIIKQQGNKYVLLMMGHNDSCAVKAQLSLLLYVQSDMLGPHFHRQIGPTSGGS